MSLMVVLTQHRLCHASGNNSIGMIMLYAIDNKANNYDKAAAQYPE